MEGKGGTHTETLIPTCELDMLFDGRAGVSHFLMFDEGAKKKNMLVVRKEKLTVGKKEMRFRSEN